VVTAVVVVVVVNVSVYARYVVAVATGLCVMYVVVPRVGVHDGVVVTHAVVGIVVVVVVVVTACLVVVVIIAIHCVCACVVADRRVVVGYVVYSVTYVATYPPASPSPATTSPLTMYTPTPPTTPT